MLELSNTMLVLKSMDFYNPATKFILLFHLLYFPCFNIWKAKQIYLKGRYPLDIIQHQSPEWYDSGGDDEIQPAATYYFPSVIFDE